MCGYTNTSYIHGPSGLRAIIPMVARSRDTFPQPIEARKKHEITEHSMHMQSHHFISSATKVLVPQPYCQFSIHITTQSSSLKHDSHTTVFRVSYPTSSAFICTVLWPGKLLAASIECFCSPYTTTSGMDDDTAYLTSLLTWPALGLEGCKTPASHEANIEGIPAEISNSVMFIS